MRYGRHPGQSLNKLQRYLGEKDDSTSARQASILRAWVACASLASVSGDLPSRSSSQHLILTSSEAKITVPGCLQPRAMRERRIGRRSVVRWIDVRHHRKWRGWSAALVRGSFSRALFWAHPPRAGADLVSTNIRDTVDSTSKCDFFIFKLFLMGGTLFPPSMRT